LSLRRRMLKTLDYNLDEDPDDIARLAGIHIGAGHLDMANDLLACADYYRERTSDIDHDKKNYRKTDEADARRLADKILRLLGAVTTPDQTLWKSYQARSFTLLLTHDEEARRVGRFLSYYEACPGLGLRGDLDVDRGAGSRGEDANPRARGRAPHAWLVDPIAKTLEVYTLDAHRRWSEPVIHREVEVVRVVPFDAIELDLSALWT